MIKVSGYKKKLLRLLLVFFSIKGRHGLFVKRGSRLLAAETLIGCGTRVNGRLLTKGKGPAAIGRYCAFGYDIKMITSNHDVSKPILSLFLARGLEIKSSQADSEKLGVTISDNVWVGDSVIFLPGVMVGAGSIVAAGSVVTKSIPENSIYGGVPARFISKRINHEIHQRLEGLSLWAKDPVEIRKIVSEDEVLRREYKC